MTSVGAAYTERHTRPHVLLGVVLTKLTRPQQTWRSLMRRCQFWLASFGWRTFSKLGAVYCAALPVLAGAVLVARLGLVLGPVGV